MNHKPQLLSLISGLLLLISASSYAEMVLDNEHSTISFVSVKKSTAAEVHTINKISGALSDTGELKIELDLSSVNTKIDVRDQRMKEYLFEVTRFPKATLTAKVVPIAENSAKQFNTEAMLEMHGMSQKIKVDVTVIRSGSSMLVTSTMPVIINAVDFKLVEGIEKLRELAKLPSISTAVPVSFVLVFSAPKN